jgi:hypothetical protein
MTTVRKAGQLPKDTAAQKAPLAGKPGRRPWVKKTPIEVVLAQIGRVREDVAKREEELKQARRELQKLEEARKLLEST